MSYQVIARKFRPQKFEEISGQELIVRTLQNAVSSGRIAHGYIFSGARGVGKTSAARILAKSLNCAKGPTISPCGECASCLEIAAGNSPDVFEIDAASNRGIDEIRQLRESSRYMPARDRFRVFIIDEAHMLTTEAFNALLKTLEEPPPQSLFVLATTEPHKLPPTIQSRCQHFAFQLLASEEIVARLRWVCAQEKIEADEEALSALARAAEGSMRDGLSLLDQVIAAGDARLEGGRVRQLLGVIPAETLARLVNAVAAGQSPDVLAILGELVKEGYDLAHFSGQLTRFIRDLAILKNCGADSTLLDAPPGERAMLAKLAAAFSEADLARFFQILLRVESEMRYSLHPRFDLELALLKLVYAKRLEPLENLIAELKDTQPTGTARTNLPSRESSAPATSARPAAPSAIQKPSAAAALDLASAPQAQPTPAKPVTSNYLESSAAAVAPAREKPIAQDPVLTALKTFVFEKSKFVASWFDSVMAYRLENGAVELVCSKETIGAARMTLETRETQELLRAAFKESLGQPVRAIYVKLDVAGQVKATARERAERDEGVRAFENAFHGVLGDVTDLASR